MKKIIPFYLYPNVFKKIGLVISLIGIILYLFQHQDFQLLYYLGLILIVFAKESSESDAVAEIRNETLRIVFGYFIGLIFTIFLVGIIYKDISFPHSPFLLVGLPLILCIFYFNLLLIINKAGGKGKNEKQGHILWLGFALAGFLLIALVNILG